MDADPNDAAARAHAAAAAAQAAAQQAQAAAALAVAAANNNTHWGDFVVGMLLGGLTVLGWHFLPSDRRDK